MKKREYCINEVDNDDDDLIILKIAVKGINFCANDLRVRLSQVSWYMYVYRTIFFVFCCFCESYNA